MKLTIKRRIMLLYTLLTTILLGILLPIVYVTVSASLNLDIQSRLNNAIAQVLIAVDDQDEKFVLNDQVDLPDYISMCVMDGNGKLIFSTPGGEWLPQVSTDTTGNTIYRNETYTVLREKFKIEENTVTAFAAISSDYALRSLNILKLLLIILTPIYLVFSVAGAYILARRAIRPIAEITKAAESINAKDLSKRITGITTKDEVQKLADTFNIMLDRLQESFERERQFTSDASHELRTPVAVISACAEDLRGCVQGSDSRQSLEAIEKESERMNKIISQLLLLTRGYEGRYHMEKEVLELHEVVGSVMAELSEMAADSQIRLFNKVPEKSTVFADQSLITQLLINLIGNSIKYGVRGGKVTVRASNSERGCTFTVSDNGIGIREDELEHVFERFYRADKARDRSGSGLGLSIVKWIVALHNGKISIRSQYGKGTQVTVALSARKL